MASTSALLNRELREYVSPVLRHAGFQQVDARNGWSWRDDDCIWVFNIRAVGSYFSQSTNWPAGSVCVWLGVFFTFTPRPADLKADDQGRLLPPEHLCHMRSHLDCGVDQSAKLRAVSSVERRRTDIWWVEPDGSNGEAVARDIAASLAAKGLPWFARSSDVRAALAEVEATRDCFGKFVRASLFAKHLGDHDKWRKYDALAEAEAHRIGQSVDRDTWWGI